ncbi:MAG: hypothetical protein CMO55_14570 [Verrucomicrobiales bacterium]|nr:hypothetical protein [Verrucomicrobiales bacterium]
MASAHRFLPLLLAALSSAAILYSQKASAQHPGRIHTLYGSDTQGFSGDGGPAADALFSSIRSITMNADGDLFLLDRFNYRIRKIDAATKIVTTIAGNGANASTGDGGLATEASIQASSSIACDSAGNIYFTETTNHIIRRILVSTGIIETFAGTGSSGFSGDNGDRLSAQFNEPTYIAFDSDDNLYVTDFRNDRIRRIAESTGICTTIAGGSESTTFLGDGGLAIDSRFNSPDHLHIDTSDNIFFSTLNRVVKIDAATSLIHTIVGTGEISFNGNGLRGAATNIRPSGIATGPDGAIFISDYNRLRRYDPTADRVFIYAGTMAPGNFREGAVGTSTALDSVLRKVLVMPRGEILFSHSSTIKSITSNGPAPTHRANCAVGRNSVRLIGFNKVNRTGRKQTYESYIKRKKNTRYCYFALRNDSHANNAILARYKLKNRRFKLVVRDDFFQSSNSPVSRRGNSNVFDIDPGAKKIFYMLVKPKFKKRKREKTAILTFRATSLLNSRASDTAKAVFYY